MAAAAAAVAVASAGCGDVEWDAPEHFDDWVTSNRYIEASHEAAHGMAMTVFFVAAIFVWTFVVWVRRQRAAGRPVFGDLPLGFFATSFVLAVLTCAWVATVFS